MNIVQHSQGLAGQSVAPGEEHWNDLIAPISQMAPPRSNYNPCSIMADKK